MKFRHEILSAKALRAHLDRAEAQKRLRQRLDALSVDIEAFRKAVARTTFSAEELASAVENLARSAPIDL